MKVIMRSFIRHPINIPIEFEAGEKQKRKTPELKNVSTGGLCFLSDEVFEKGELLRISIPNFKSEFTEDCVVVWCKKKGEKYDVGVKFLDDQTTFRMRMVEQICYIENYRKELLAKEGRRLTLKEASAEWIKKFAKEFPRV